MVTLRVYLKSYIAVLFRFLFFFGYNFFAIPNNEMLTAKIYNTNHRFLNSLAIKNIMSDLDETIQESVSHAKESRINSVVAILVALTATFMAICNIKDGNIVQAMSQAQAHGIDAWSYFQAKSTKQSIAENALELLKLQKFVNDGGLVKKYEEKIATYEKEKAVIKSQAEGFVKEYDDINIFDDQFDMTDAFLSISIALFGITALTQKKWLLWFATGVSLAGFIFGVTAFLKISLHSDFISRILG